jgi:hypothetical protein
VSHADQAFFKIISRDPANQVRGIDGRNPRPEARCILIRLFNLTFYTFPFPPPNLAIGSSSRPALVLGRPSDAGVGPSTVISDPPHLGSERPCPQIPPPRPRAPKGRAMLVIVERSVCFHLCLFGDGHRKSAEPHERRLTVACGRQGSLQWRQSVPELHPGLARLHIQQAAHEKGPQRKSSQSHLGAAKDSDR